MKRFGKGFAVVMFGIGLIGFAGNVLLTPLNCEAKEEKAVKEEKASKEVKPAKAEATPAESKGTKEAKKVAKQAPAKKSVKAGPAPMVTVMPPVATLAKKLSVTIMGAGYTPDEELRILFYDIDGMQTNIGYALDPPPKANKSGAWMTTWAVDDFIAGKLVTAGVFALTVTDNDYRPIAQTVTAFKEAAKAEPAADKKGAETKTEGGKSGEKAEKKSEKKSDSK